MAQVQTVPAGGQTVSPRVYKHNKFLEAVKKIGLAMAAGGILMLLISLSNISSSAPVVFFIFSFGLIISGALIYFIPQINEAPAGIKNNGIFFNSLTSKGTPAWIIGITITAFYIILYWFPALIENWVKLVNPVSIWLSGQQADRWFLYGTFYTLAVLVMGVRMMIKYRHNRYQVIRTVSVSFFQLGFAFLIPSFLEKLNKPGFYFTYFWPLKYNYLFPGDIHYLIGNLLGIAAAFAVNFTANNIWTWRR